MAKVDRFAYTNHVQAAASVLVPSSEETSLPRSALTRHKLSDVWRTKTGWTIVAGENDKIDVIFGGTWAVTVAAGTYATGALLAAAIDTALSTIPLGVWTVTYDAGTKKFSIQQTAGVPDSFELRFATGANVAKSIHLDIGYTSTDKGPATTITAENVAYQSRHSLNVDLGSAQSFTAGIVRGHNVSSAGTVTLQADVATMVGVGLSDTSVPDFTQTLAGAADPRISFFASQSKRYLRLVISDVQSPIGYNEVGIAFVGPYSQPTILESINFVEDYEPLSEILVAIGGSHDTVLRTRRLVYTLNWEEIEDANIDIFRALNLAMPMGACFFLSLDAADNPTTTTIYGYFRSGLSIPMQSGPYSNVGPLQFAEELP